MVESPDFALASSRFFLFSRSPVLFGNALSDALRQMTRGTLEASKTEVPKLLLGNLKTRNELLIPNSFLLW
jgi:hypothetical protein